MYKLRFVPKSKVENYVILPRLIWWPLKPPAPTIYYGFSFGVSLRVGCVPWAVFTLGILSRRKGFTVYITWKFDKNNQRSLHHWTTFKALGSLEVFKSPLLVKLSLPWALILKWMHNLLRAWPYWRDQYFLLACLRHKASWYASSHMQVTLTACHNLFAELLPQVMRRGSSAKANLSACRIS